METDRNIPPNWAWENLEAYLDGDLPIADRGRFEEWLESSPALREELEQACGLRDEFRTLPMRTCPDRVTHAVLRQIEPPGRGQVRERESLFAWLSLRSALAGAVAVCLFVAVMVGRYRREEAILFGPGGSAAAARVVGQQIEATLTYLARVGVVTGAAVGQEVYRAGVVAPIRETTRVLSEIKLPSIGRAEKNQEG